LHHPGCDLHEPPFDAQIGRLSANVDPVQWKPYAPNLAFEEINDDDSRWIARRLAALRRDHIEAAVSAAQYSRPEDAAYLVETLEKRRETIVRHYVRGDEGSSP